MWLFMRIYIFLESSIFQVYIFVEWLAKREAKL